MKTTLTHSKMSLLLASSLIATACHDGELFGPLDVEINPTVPNSNDPDDPNSNDPNPGSGGENPDPRGTGNMGGSMPLGGNGGIGGEASVFIPPPPRTLFRGTLSPQVSICWVTSNGPRSDSEISKQQGLYRIVIEEWLGDDNSLELEFLEECSEPKEGIFTETLRILLEDRSPEDRPSTIDGCQQLHTGATWAATPDEQGAYRHCAWNVSLAFHLRRKSSVLHAAGHALGLVHDHFGWTNQCPLSEPAAFTWSPYFERQDHSSVMLAGVREYSEYSGSDPCEEPRRWNDLSPTRTDRLALSLLYPADTNRTLFNRGTGVPGPDGYVFRSDQTIRLSSDFLAQGVSPEWIEDPLWTHLDASSGTPINIPGESLVRDPASIPDGPISITHTFSTPAGTSYSGHTTIEISDSKHTAVIQSIL